MMMTTKSYTAKEIYELAARDNGRTPVADLANRLNMRSPNFIAQALQYGQEHKLPVPEFCFHRKKPGAADSMISRAKTSLDVRVSSYKLSAAGLGNVYHFDTIVDDSDAENPRLIIQAAKVEQVPPADDEPTPTPSKKRVGGRAGQGPTTEKRSGSRASLQVAN